MNIYNFYDTPLIKNSIKFADINETNFSASIKMLALSFYNNKLSEKLFNTLVFYNSSVILICGVIDFIENETFQNLIYVKRILLEIFHSAKFLLKTIEWINHINYEIDTGDDLLGYVVNNPNVDKLIGMNFSDYTLSDEDLCLFKEFPHKKLLFPLIFDASKSCNCTYIWLTQKLFIYQNVFSISFSIYSRLTINLNEEYIDILCNFSEQQFLACRFETKLNNCYSWNTSLELKKIENNQYNQSIYDQAYNTSVYVYVTKLFITPLFLFIGFIINVLMLRILREKTNSKYFEKIFLDMLKSILTIILYFALYHH